MKRPIARKKTKSQQGEPDSAPVVTGPKPMFVTHPEIVGVIEDLLKKGYSVTMVCDTIGINRQKFYDWIKGANEEGNPHRADYEDLAKRIAAAKAYAKQRIIDVITKAAYGTEEKAGDWRAMAWLGERLYPEDFGAKEEVRHSHSGTVNVEHKAIVFNLPSVMAQPRLVEGKTIEAETTHEPPQKEK